MAETKLNHPKSQDQRIADRLKQSNDMGTANAHSVQGSGPTRVHTTVHHTGHQAQGAGHGPVDHGVGDISGGKR